MDGAWFGWYDTALHWGLGKFPYEHRQQRVENPGWPQPYSRYRRISTVARYWFRPYSAPHSCPLLSDPLAAYNTVIFLALTSFWLALHTALFCRHLKPAPDTPPSSHLLTRPCPILLHCSHALILPWQLTGVGMEDDPLQAGRKQRKRPIQT